MKKISIVIPAHNEEGNVFLIHQRIKEVFANMKGYSFEIIFVNDGSRDQTQAKLEELAAQFEEVKFLEFSRNFGHQPAVKAGLDFANGNAVISMDADLQHPPELIPEMIAKWEQGYDLVYTVRKYAENVSFFKKFTSNLYYDIISKLSDFEFEKGVSDFRLMDAKVVEVMRNMTESDLFLRGMVKWMGYKQIGIPYVAQDRYSGESKYNFSRMFRLALTGVTSFSVKPLYIAAYLGFLFSGLSVLVYIPYVIYAFVSGTEISGWASLIMTVVFFGGVQLIIMGIFGMYLGKIFKQVKERPNYIVRSKNF